MENNNEIVISIVMGIYNCEDTIEKAIESIITQTYKKWELIMCDDGSTDNTYEIALSYSNKYNNITILKNKNNKGLSYSLNKCIEISKGKYIGRQDGDDISLPTRIEKEINFLENNKKYSFVSSSVILFDEKSDWGIKKYPEKVTKMDLVSGTKFWHGPIVMRRDALINVGMYTDNKRVLRVEDYNLWIKLYSKGYIGYNIQECLYKQLENEKAMGRRKYKYRINEAYVMLNGYKKLKIKKRYYIYCLRPLLVGLLPRYIYIILHKWKLKKVNNN